MTDEKQFFEEAKKSDRMVLHFYRISNTPCLVVDKHLARLAQIHVETKFMKINAEKSPFLTERLKIWMLPTMVLVKNGKTEHSIIGLDELGGKEDFTQETLQWVLSRHGVIDYDGPEPDLDDVKRKLNIQKGRITSSRHNRGQDSDEDDDY
eukprot:TRINITY_DN4325_c1_g1_i2.p1 TRINITY_DN4325_c1_g1~~TRINITY_DN4325_c1_g1_i2.p1  ORF type:complete len:151 (+),score=36.50 TRINITY_DN4325_c1_g1_i2:305-757(+)